MTQVAMAAAATSRDSACFWLTVFGLLFLAWAFKKDKRGPS